VQTDPQARQLVESWRDAERLFSEVHFVELNQSMSGGGGPACLRLRVPVTRDQLDRLSSRSRWSENLDEQLRRLIEMHYPARLTLDDLTSDEWVNQARRAQHMVAHLLG
jgi:succinylarginine dihydrolase